MNAHLIYLTLLYLSGLSILLPISAGVIKFKTLDNPSRVLLFYACISATTEVLSFLYSDNEKVYFTIQNSFVFLEFLLLSIVFYLELSSKVWRSIVLVSLVLYFIYSSAFYLNAKTFFVSENLLSIIESVLLICFSVYFFYKIQVDLNVPKLKNYSFFWLNIGIMLYFSSSFILFLFNDFLTTCSKSDFEELWSLHLLANVTFNTLIAVGIWQVK